MTAASTASSVTPATSSSTAPAVVGVPGELERGVDVVEDRADAGAVADDDRGAEQGAAADEPLGGADQLHPPARVDAVGARAVLARDLAHARVDAERAQRARQPLALGGEALVGADDGVLERPHDVDRQRRGVVGGGVAAGEPEHRLVAVRAGRFDRIRVARAQRVELAEGDGGRRAVDAQGRGQLAGRHAGEQRVRDRELEGGRTGGPGAHQLHRV